MRQSLLTDLLEVAAENLKHADAVRLFEIGAVYLPQPGERLPREPRRLAIVLCGRRRADAWDDPQDQPPAPARLLRPQGRGRAADRGAAPAGGRRSGPTKDVPYLHPGRAAELLVDGRAVGTFGELHPKPPPRSASRSGPVLVAELDLDAICSRRCRSGSRTRRSRSTRRPCATSPSSSTRR